MKSNLEECFYKATKYVSQTSNPFNENVVESLSEENISFHVKECKTCEKCAIYCYRILKWYNLLIGAYSVIGLALKYMFTSFFTQVACERSFSTLKNK